MNKKNITLTLFALAGLAVCAGIFYFSFFVHKNNVASELTAPAAPESSLTNNSNISANSSDEVTGQPQVDAATTSAKTKPIATQPNAITTKSTYPLHTNITATVFWVGEPKGGGSSENNALSAWDDLWQKHYGCFDNPSSRNGYYPKGCTPKENPFYFDLPYDDFNWDTGDGRRSNAYQVVPWASSKKWSEEESMLKNRWIKITKGTAVCYGQWEDSGPYVYDDARYVFGKNDERPKSKEANNAGMDVSPAMRDCLKFQGLNNDTNKVSWQFVESGDVPAGPWKNIITTSGTYWK